MSDHILFASGDLTRVSPRDPVGIVTRVLGRNAIAHSNDVSGRETFTFAPARAPQKRLPEHLVRAALARPDLCERSARFVVCADNTRLGDAGVADVARCAALSHEIIELDLRNTDMSAQGAQRVVELMASNTSVISIRMGEPFVDNKDVFLPGLSLPTRARKTTVASNGDDDDNDALRPVLSGASLACMRSVLEQNKNLREQIMKQNAAPGEDSNDDDDGGGGEQAYFNVYGRRCGGMYGLCSVAPLRNVAFIDVSDNGLFEVHPSVFTETCDTLRWLNVSCNRLGRIDGAIGRCTMLRYLDASDNRLVELPDVFGGCALLRSVTLRGNRLIEVPDSLFLTPAGSGARGSVLAVTGNPLIDVSAAMRSARGSHCAEVRNSLALRARARWLARRTAKVLVVNRAAFACVGGSLADTAAERADAHAEHWARRAASWRIDGDHLCVEAHFFARETPQAYEVERALVRWHMDTPVPCVLFIGIDAAAVVQKRTRQVAVEYMVDEIEAALGVARAPDNVRVSVVVARVREARRLCADIADGDVSVLCERVECALERIAKRRHGARLDQCFVYDEDADHGADDRRDRGAAMPALRSYVRSCAPPPVTPRLARPRSQLAASSNRPAPAPPPQSRAQQFAWHTAIARYSEQMCWRADNWLQPIMEESRLQEALGNSARRPSIMPPTPGGVTFAAMHALVDVVRARSFSVRARLPGDDAHRQRHHLVVLDTERVAQLLCELLHRLRLACNSNSLCSVEEMCAAWEAIAPSRRANTPLQFVVGLAIEAGLLVQTSGGAYAAQTPMWLVAFAREIPAAEVLDKQRARYGAFDALACVTRIFRFDVGRELVLEAHANIAATMLVARGNLTIDVWRGGILYTTERRAEEPCAALVCMYVDGAGDLCVRIGARHRDVTHRVATHALSSVADALEEGMQMRHEATLCMCPAGEMRYMRERSANHRHHFDQAGIVERVMQGARNQALVCPACAEAVPVECVAPDLSPQYISRADARDTGGMVLIDELEPYVVGEPLGVGAFGTVVRAHVPGVVRDVAVKTLDRVSPREGSDAVRDLCSEMRLMAFVGKHENIVRLYGVVRSPPGMVLELADRGSLFEYIHERSSSSSRSSGDRESGRGSARLRRISMPAPRAPDFIECRLRLVLDVARGLAHTHARGILHRDLKSPNVLLFERRQAKSGERRRGVPDVVAKICDYGLGVSTSMTRQVREVRGDNPLWMAPEIMAGRAYSGASDVYGLGVIAYELVYERLPFADEHCKNAEVERRIMAGQRPLLDDNDGGGDANYNADANRIIEACWAHAPECRPSAARLCAMLEAAIDLRRRARRGGSRILANTLGEPRAAPPGAAL